jgi:hypothetical protein
MWSYLIFFLNWKQSTKTVSIFSFLPRIYLSQSHSPSSSVRKKHTDNFWGKKINYRYTPWYFKIVALVKIYDVLKMLSTAYPWNLLYTGTLKK